MMINIQKRPMISQSKKKTHREFLMIICTVRIIKKNGRM